MSWKKYLAVVHYKDSSGQTMSEREIEVIEYLKKNHLDVTGIEETAVVHGKKTMFRHKVSLTEGIGSVGYSNIAEMIQLCEALNFISLKVKA